MARAAEAGDDAGGLTVHASCVAQAGRAVLIRGAAGSGKSGLALRLIALGAELVADDRTRVWRAGDQVMADAPDTIRGRIEARGIGLLRLPAAGPRPLALVVDLDGSATERLPPLRETRIVGAALPLVHGSGHAHFPAAIALYLRYGVLE
ncbi:serine kinase [Roseovarius sp. A46]|uniref:HPr kinase/phosphorylase n=1 Tax=Roseovarius sp. A46 TaxID=2109331 RepID=UPI0010116EA2|nr:serine kinase [Roseovarius sp. A46]RXV58821.1 serine kinase [Roseovarius sp. A46]